MRGLPIAVDGSEGSRKALEYVAAIARERRGLHIHLLHALPPPPPALQEFGGAEDPEEERELRTQTAPSRVAREGGIGGDPGAG